ncbi:MAG: DUF362 domain-containing protein [Armatimonadota bacterium]
MLPGRQRSSGWIMGAAGVCLCLMAAQIARAGPGVPEQSRVAVAQAERIMAPEGPLTPYIYPEGKVEYGIVELLLDRAVTVALGADDAEDAWSMLFKPNDRVGIQLDVGQLQVHQEVLEALILRILGTGVRLRNIIIYSGDEAELFRAGFDLSGRTPGVRVMASDAEGYRSGISRIVLDYTTKIVNVSRLRIDEQVGMYAALANCLNSVPYVDRQRLRREPEKLAEAAANASLRRATVLHVVDALRPGWRRAEGQATLETWLYRGILASTDPVALDTTCRRILLEQWREESPEVEHLNTPVVYLEPATGDFRLGNSDPERIEVVSTRP